MFLHEYSPALPLTHLVAGVFAYLAAAKAPLDFWWLREFVL